MNDYAVTDRSRLRRVHERAHFDRATIHAILDEGLICLLGFAVEGKPFVIPTAYWRDGETVYVHGSSASRTMRALAEGAEACLTVTHLDGLVYARSGFHHSMNFRSVMIFGVPRLVEDETEKMAALEAFMRRIGPGRWDETRPPDDQEFKATKVLALALEEVSAKVRTGPPVDDEADYALPCWAGVVPLRLVAGDPIDDDRLTNGASVPDYARNFRFRR